MTLRLLKNHQITALNSPQAIAASSALRRRGTARQAAAALVVALVAATPLFAGLEPGEKGASTARSSSNLKWRSPQLDSAASADETASSAPSTKPLSTARTAVSAGVKSAGSQWNIRSIPDAEAAAAKSTSAARSNGTSSSATAGTKGTRAPSKVSRLADASPSPHSSSVAAGSNSLKILRTSNEEPLIEPFGDDQPAFRAADARAKKRAAQVGLQDRDPFGDAPRLERNPSGSPPERIPSELAQEGSRTIPAVCPSPKDYIKKLADISTNIAVEPGELPQECGLGDEQFVPRNWQCTLYAWKASALCHKPLYFEDVELERYGQTCSPLLQPFISGAKFWLTFPILPYKFGLEPPCECIYPLGYYRPGSCAPFIIPPVPISVRGALLEAGVWVAGVALVP